MKTFLFAPSFSDTARMMSDIQVKGTIAQVLDLAHDLAHHIEWTESWRRTPLSPDRIPVPLRMMWADYPSALIVYGMCMSNELAVGRLDRSDKSIFRLHDLATWNDWREYVSPPWLRDEDVHQSHKSAFFAESSPFFWPIPDEDDPRGYKLWLSTREADLVSAGKLSIPNHLRLDGREVVLS